MRVDGACTPALLPALHATWPTFSPLRHACATAALHVAAATGRADVVRQLAAAGASVNKALPMDYRTLLRQGQQAQQAQQGQQGQATADGQQPAEGEAAEEAAVAEGSEAGCDEDELCSGWGQATAGAEEHAPPPKRGRYITAGPAAPGPPSLQYCTALHCAALGGHLKAAQALLATGQVSCRLCWGVVVCLSLVAQPEGLAWHALLCNLV